MRRPFILALLFAGCQACPADVPSAVEGQVAAVASARTEPAVIPCSHQDTSPALPEPADLHALWALALVHNSVLRESAAELEAAQGRWVQAGKYPNPRLRFEEDTIGAAAAPAGNLRVEVSQEVVTAGKKRLDRAVAAREVDQAAVALLGRKLEILSRLRRTYYDYVSWSATEQAGAEVVAALEEGLASTRRLVEKAVRPRTDLLRAEALTEEARISLARTRANRSAAWRQLAAEVGMPDLPAPHQAGALGAVPDWQADAVRQRVLTAHTSLRENAFAIQEARLAWQRASAEAVPNVTVGAGYTDNRIENAAGALVTVEAPLPLWDRKQGLVHEAQARWVRAQAALRSTEARLSQQIAAAFAGYEAGRTQVERLEREVLPRLRTSLELLRKGYEAGAAQITFTDVLQSEQALVNARLNLAEARRALWLAVADLEALMQLDLDEAPGPSASLPARICSERGV